MAERAAGCCSSRRVYRGRGLLVAAALLAAVAGAVPATAQEADAAAQYTGPKTNLRIVLWKPVTEAQKTALSDLVFGFQRSNPDVVIALEWLEAELAGEYVRRWMGSLRQHAPDITVLTDIWAHRHRSRLLPLPRDLLLQSRRQFAQSILDRGEGTPPGVPWSVSTPALYYRPRQFQQLDLPFPQTPQELIDAGVALRQPPTRFGLGVPAPGAGCEELVHALTLAVGPNDDVLGSDAWYLPGAELLIEMRSASILQPEILTWTEPELLEMFIEGRIAMMIAGPSAAAKLAREEARREQRAEEDPEHALPTLDWAVAPLPRAEGGVAQVQVDWIAAFADTDRPQEARRFLRYLASEEKQRELGAIFGVCALSDPGQAASEDPVQVAHGAGLSNARGVPLEGWEDQRSRLANALALALSGRMTVTEALLESSRAAMQPGG